MYKEALALNNLQGLICHKNKPTRQNYLPIAEGRKYRFISFFKNTRVKLNANSLHHIQVWTHMWWCPWCNGYRRRKWIRRNEFKSWTKLIAIHIALIPLGKVWIQLFSLQLWVEQTGFFSLGEATSLGERKLVKPRLKIDVVSYPARAEGLLDMDTQTHGYFTYIYIYIYIYIMIISKYMLYIYIYIFNPWKIFCNPRFHEVCL